MFRSIALLALRRPRTVLAATAVFLALAGAVGTGVFGRLSAGGFGDPAAESTRAEALLRDRFGSGTPNFVVVASVGEPQVDEAGQGAAVDDPGVVAAGEELTRRLRDDAAVTEVLGYWNLGRISVLRSDEGTSAVVAARLDGDEDAVLAESSRLRQELGDRLGPLELGYSGQGPVFSAVSDRIESDLATAESLAVPLVVLLLVVVFGGLVAAGLPLLVGAVSVLGTFFSLWMVTLFTDVSIFSINLVTALGLGLAIDYSLFIVSRFREELAARPRSHWAPDEHRAVRAAVLRTVETAGRTVAVSALTVAVSLSALLVFPLYFLRSFAFAGVGVTLVAAATSVVALPALLALLGRRVDLLSLRRHPGTRAAANGVAAKERNIADGFWYRRAHAVMRHPVVVGGAVVLVLLVLGSPFLQARFGVPDERVLPAGDPARVATEQLRNDFASDEVDAIAVVLDSERAGGDPADTEVARYASALSNLDGVTRVDAPTGRYIGGVEVMAADAMLAAYRVPGAIRLGVVSEVVPISADGERLVADIRAVPAPAPAFVGGGAAEFVDSTAAIAERLPWAVAIIVVATFILLFLMFGSLLVPLKAIVLNVLSLSATFGAMVWIFQEGHLAGALGVTATGLTDTTTPILMFCIAFGLSMDYEVFLLSRIKEEYDRTGDNAESIAVGLQRSGRIVTAAAALITVTFLAFSVSGIAFIKLFGLGLALAVVLDATLIRLTLVPAFMALAGDTNWWAPAWMQRIRDRIGLSEGESPGDRDDPPNPASATAPDPADESPALRAPTPVG